MMRKLLLLLSYFSCLAGLSAQDAHYSDFSFMPMYLNPALTGNGTEGWRIGGMYRSQWKLVDAPYQNTGVFLDKNRKGISFGLILNQNKAGDTGYRKTLVMLSGALKKKLGEGNNELALGAQVGFNQHRIDINALTFDSQYNPDKGFDEMLGSGEFLETGSLLLPDVNIGVNWDFQRQSRLPIDGNIGLAFSHLNNPKASFYEDNVKFPLKTTLYGFAEIMATKKLGLQPRVLYTRQGTAKELLLGLNLGFHFKPQQIFSIGLALRSKDALIFTGGLEVGRWQMTASFDGNTSSLRDASSGNRAIELGLIYHISRPRMVVEPKDTDKDGILDRDDDCPKVPGIEELNGCPEGLDTTVVRKPIDKPFKDFDKDGVSDENDLCPYTAGFLEYQGCRDTDQDGIWDHIDACPLIPGKVESYGCPVKIPGIDSDNDGVPDRFDQCIYLKGLEALNGCPDSDMDGISDIKDECPYLKGVVQYNGCPDRSKKYSDTPFQIENVEFDTDKSIIKGFYNPMLDRLVFYVQSNPSTRVILDGHTDAEGDHLYNYQLSQRRAQAVRTYLIRKGMPAENIEIHFYGETKPSKENDSGYGKARNRRVEIILMK